MMDLGSFVAERRKELKLTQRDLSDALGYTPQAISRFEKKNGALPITILPTLASLLHCTIRDLFNRRVNEGVDVNYAPIDVDLVRNNFVILRQNFSFSKKDEAAALGIAKNSISNYEEGKSILTTAVVEKVARFFGIDVEDFLLRPLRKITSEPSHPSRLRPALSR